MADKVYIEDSSVTSIPCKVSMCEQPEVTPVDITLGDPKKLIIEFDSSGEYSLNMSVGKITNVGDIAGTVNNIKVKSSVKFVPTEIHPSYIIGEYVESDQYSANDIDAMINSGDEFSEISDLLKEYTNVNNFIKCSLLYCQIPRLATFTKEYTKGNAKELNIEDMVNGYNKSASKITDKYDADIQELMKKENIQAYAENDNLPALKDEMDRIRRVTFKQIFSMYNQPGINNTCCLGRMGDFMLYDKYMGYITSDVFMYDDENPHMVDLFNYINERIGIRSRLENNMSTIAAQITNFNNEFNGVLGSFWNMTKDKDYYSQLKKILKYDFYENKDSDVEALRDTKNRVTIYSKTLDYLKNLCSYNTPAPKSINKEINDANGNVIAVQEISDYNSLDTTLEDRLKKIAIMFCRLRKIESGMNSEAYRMYVDNDDLDNVFTLKKQMNEKYFNEYKGADKSTIGSNEGLFAGDTTAAYAATKILDKYLGAMKSVCDEEARYIKSMCDDIIEWYMVNSPGIDDKSIFDKFKTISFPSPSKVKKDGETYDFYYVTYTSEIVPPEGYEYTEDSMLTEHGPNTYLYWLRYLGIASLVNCSIPLFWSTGLITPAGPQLLPIILIPVFVMDGRVTCVMGLGICGLAIYPMMLFVNMSSEPGMMIPMINNLIDSIKNTVKLMMSKNLDAIKNDMYTPLIKAVDAEIDDIKQQISDIDKDIQNISESVKTDKSVVRAIKKKNKEISTTKNPKKGIE